MFDDYWIGEYVRAAWRKEDDDGVKWMDVVGAVDEIINDKTGEPDKERTNKKHKNILKK